ncbi:MAG: hypothetical protein ACI9O4_000837 [Chitinophagales bacterium]|jgi:hypothetical protein
MKKNRINNWDDALASIEKVEASPYLIARVRQRINSNVLMTKPQAWGIALSFSLVLAVNIFAFTALNKSTEVSPEKTGFEYLLPQNNLY